MSYILYLVLAICILLFMVLVHEFGHYIVGRMLNFKITEFSVGFGKALFSRRNKRGELISLRVVPLGGYCAFVGEDETDKDNKDAFTNQAPWKRILVFLAGVTFNFATAVVFSLILLCTVGYDIPQVKNITNTIDFNSKYKIENVIGDAYAPNILTEEQLQERDIIISIDGKKIDFAYGSNYNDLIAERAKLLNGDVYTLVGEKSKLLVEFDEEESEELPLTTQQFNDIAVMNAVVKRDGEYKNIKLTFYRVEVEILDKENNPTGETEYKYIWNTQVKAYVHNFGEGLRRAVPFAFGLAFTVLKSFWLLITFQLPISAVGGPITTISTIATVTQASLSNILLLIPLISANLAIFNLLPIPALDGAHVLFTTIEAIRKKPIKRETENLIHTIGLLILFGFVILIDILHFIL